MGLQYIRIADPACQVTATSVSSTAAELYAPHITKDLPLTAQLASFATEQATSVFMAATLGA